MRIPDSDLALATEVALRDDEPLDKLVMLCQLVAMECGVTRGVHVPQEDVKPVQLGLGL